MGLALEEAAAALKHDDVPIGAVVVAPDGAVVGRRHNERELTGDPTAHAEVLALRDAAALAGTWRLDGHVLVVTIEPCPMCAGAIRAAWVARLVYGAPDHRAGAAGSVVDTLKDPRLPGRVEVQGGVLAKESLEVLQGFFDERR